MYKLKEGIRLRQLQDFGYKYVGNYNRGDQWLKEKYCIPIQKIKAKIEELDIAISECIYLDEDDEKYKKAVEKDKLCLLNQKRALQELLEGRE